MSETVEEKCSGGAKLHHNAGFLSSAQILKRLCRLGMLVIAARALGTEVFGHYILLLTITELMAIISGGGYVDFVTREMAARPEKCSGLATQLTVLRTIYLGLALVVAIAILKSLHYPSAMMGFVALMTIALLPRVIVETCQGLLRGAARFRAMPVIEIVQGIVLIAAGTALLFIHRSLTALIVAEIVSSAAGAACALFLSFGLWKIEWDVHEGIAAVSKRALPFNVYPFIVNVYDRADVMVLSKLAGDSAVGLYSMAYRAMASLQILPTALMGALLPRLSGARLSSDRREDCSRSMRFLYLISLFFILGAMFFADDGVKLVLGPAYHDSAIALRLLIWALIPIFMNAAINTTLLAAGREKVFIVTASVCTAFNLLMNILLVPRFSYKAASVITVATELLLLGQNLWFVRRALGKIPLPQRVGLPTVLFLGFLALWIGVKSASPSWLSIALMGLFTAYLVFDIQNWIKSIRRIDEQLLALPAQGRKDGCLAGGSR